MADKEYIDKVAFNYAIREAVKKYPNSFYNGLEVARQIAHDLPAADVRPVVLCRDCKFAPIGDKDGSDLEWPFNEFDENPCPYKCLDNWYSHKPAPDFFCAAGEKREES